MRKEVQENLLKLAARIPAFMYLTDYREYSIKDVITQIEPELFKKVTGLGVKDFEILNEIGLFDPEKMNQGIFGFRKYENASLSYTGIDMHAGEDIGGWDTVLRREEYDALYAKQQASMDMPNFVDIIVPQAEPASVLAVKPATTPVTTVVTSTPVVTPTPVAKQPASTTTQATVGGKSTSPNLQVILAVVKQGTTVMHKIFGEGNVAFMDKAKKYMRVSFIINSKRVEKNFVFPDAFIDGYLTIKK